MKNFLICLLLLLCAGCGSSTSHEEETGYKGRARIDAYLAAARFLKAYGYEVNSRPSWQKLDEHVATLILPASTVASKALIKEIDMWVRRGGHLICLGERSESWHNDWRKFYTPADKIFSDDFRDWLEGANLNIEFRREKPWNENTLTVDDQEFPVSGSSSYGVSKGGGDPGLFRSATYGSGRISVLTDARLFRNRYIDENENSSVLLTLVEWSPDAGEILIIRDSALSFWGMLWNAGWPALIGLGVIAIVWLWKNMPSYGPRLAAEEPSTLRAYDHHLEALGDFHWRLDKAAGLLRPLRESILERAQQHSSAAGADNGNLFEWLAHRSGLTADRVQRAMSHESPGDPSTFTRLIADLQTLHFSLP